ncbi:MAG: glycosyltransferase family 39 protein [Terriglobia bacterium]
MIPTVSRRALTLAAVMGLMAIMEAAMLLSVRQESQTADEAHNLFAGYLYLTAGDFSAGSAHPPLAKDVSALPLLAFRPRVPPMPRGEAFSINLQDGRIFLYSNRAEPMLFAARAAMTMFPLLLALLVFAATQEMFGAAPALIALTLTAFEPNILAHGPLTTNDVALAACLFAAVYAFWRYFVNPTAWRLAVGGMAGGFTLATKHSGLMLFPILFLLALVEWLIAPRATLESTLAPDRACGTARPTTTSNEQESRAAVSRRQLALRLLLALVAIGTLSVAVLWGFYAFRYAPVAGAPTPSLAPLLDAVHSRSKAAAIAVAAQSHLLPMGYLAGLAHFYVAESRPTYLLGTRYVHGVWFYFPTALGIKCTLGFLLLLALAPLGLRRVREGRREVLWMLIPAAVFLAASMTSNLNIGVRYILPIFPFLSVLMAVGGWTLTKKHRAWGLAVGGLVLIHVGSSLRAFPNYLSYSNELWGGPSKTYRVLTDSNVDWGQGLPAVKRYVNARAATPCWLAYFGTVDPAQYDIPCTLLTVSSAVIWGRPLSEIPPVIEGTVLVSATEMSGQAWGPGELNPYEQFRTAHPVDCLAGSILVYQGSFQVPLASALSRLWKVVALANNGKFDAALAEARTAESLAPHSVDVQFVLGRVLRAAGRSEESRRAFENALHLARTIHPEAQSYWIPIIEGEPGKQ